MAIEWYELSRGESPLNPSFFFKFISVWIAFNAIYASRFSEEGNEIDQIKAFFWAESNRHKKLCIESAEYRKAVETIADWNEEKGVWDFRNKRYRQLTDTRNPLQLASCLYSIRCNLFHGQKCPSSLRDEKLAQAGFQILEKLIELEFKTQ
jgi:hypothetical protein